MRKNAPLTPQNIYIYAGWYNYTPATGYLYMYACMIYVLHVCRQIQQTNSCCAQDIITCDEPTNAHTRACSCLCIFWARGEPKGKKTTNIMSLICRRSLPVYSFLLQKRASIFVLFTLRIQLVSMYEEVLLYVCFARLMCCTTSSFTSVELQQQYVLVL